jgi:Flp pilus assembly pilin Flp
LAQGRRLPEPAVGGPPFSVEAGAGQFLKREKMKNFVMNFLHEGSGQDLIEYTLLMGFIALASAAIFISAGGSLTTIWSTASSNLSAASS